jgi:hypothetical protein
MIEEWKKGNLIVYYLSIATLWIYLASCILGKNYLYADGSKYFYDMLHHNSFVLWPFGRIHSQILMQLFSVTAIKLGVTNLPIIAGLFAFGMTFWTGLFYILSMRLCLKRNHPEYMVLTGILMCLLLIYIGFFVQIESIASVSVFCFLFFSYLLSDEKEYRTTKADKLLLLIVAVLSTRMNEYFLIWAFVLMIILVYKLHNRQIRMSLYWGIHIFLQILSIVFALLGIYFKDSSGIMYSLKTFGQNGNLILLIVLLLGVVLTSVLLAKNLYSNKFMQLLNGFLQVLFVLFLFYDIALSASKIAQKSFDVRIINLAIPVFFAAFIFFQYHFKTNCTKVKICSWGLLIGLCAFTIITPVQFHAHLKDIVSFCKENKGFISIQDSIRDGGLYQRGYLWQWAVPYESLNIQMIQGVKTIKCIIVPDNRTVGNEPFNTTNINAYADFRKYGVSYVDFQ